MSNGDSPAMPITGIRFDRRENQYTGEVQAYGLTKREYFAAMAMQGLVASDDPENPFSADSIASRAVSFADALLDRLTSTEHGGAL